MTRLPALVPDVMLQLATRIIKERADDAATISFLPDEMDQVVRALIFTAALKAVLTDVG